MPANVSYEFTNAQKKYDQASTLLEKLVALQEMKSTAPSHKGAEKLRAEISQKIARIKNQIDKEKQQAKKVTKGKSISVKKEGIGQITLIGMPNSGKSTILKALTNVDVEIADYPFTTKKPTVGMVDFSGTKIQLVEIPGIIRGASKGKAQGTQLISIIRNSDAIVAVVNSKDEFKVIESELLKSNIRMNEEKPKIEISPSKFPGFSITGKEFFEGSEEQLIDFLKGMGMFNVNVILKEKTTLDKIAQSLDEKIVYKKTIIVTRFESVKGEMEKNPKFKGKVFLIDGKEKMTELKQELFHLLGKIIIYTKKPGQQPIYEEPLVLKEGATVEEVAGKLHKDFAKNLKYVKVWGSSKFPGQRVSKDYNLKNKDVIEIYS